MITLDRPPSSPRVAIEAAANEFAALDVAEAEIVDTGWHGARAVVLAIRARRAELDRIVEESITADLDDELALITLR